MEWMPEQIDALAPDSASAAAGRQLANASKWLALGATTEALWGECQGSGKNPYQVSIDFNGPAYRCSCPSRKIPCKHCLALFYLYATKPGIFAAGAGSGWLTAWLDERKTREAKKVERAEAKTAEETPERRAKRQANRLEKSLEGLEELSIRLCDLVREGLGAAPGKSYGFWDQAARRLMDAQSPGAANRVRRLAELPATGAGWPERMLSAMGELCLLISAARHFHELPPETQADLGAALGWTEKKELVLASEGVHDTWHVMAVTVEEDTEAHLRVRRAWLWGAEAKRGAMILDFAADAQPFEGAWLPGAAFSGTLAFYPGSAPMRAVVKGDTEIRPFTMPPGFVDLDAALLAWVDATARNAWLGPFPVVLEGVIPWYADGDWVLIDRGGKAMPMRGRLDVLWPLLAEAGGRPVSVFALWHEGAFCALPPGRMDGSLPAAGSNRGAARIRRLARDMMLQRNSGEHALPSADGKLGAALAALNADSREWTTLQAAALIAAHDAAGSTPACWSGLPPAAAETDHRPEIGADAATVLALLVGGRCQVLWPEFLSLTARHGRRVPARFHPALLDYALRRKEARADVLTSLGAPGAWLAEFQDTWAALLGRTPEENPDTEVNSDGVWDAGTTDERVAWLTALRRADPGAARDRMAERFKKETAAARLAFVEALANRLSMEDEEFLESALDDTSSRVNASAAALLPRLPESRLVRRATTLLDALVVPKKKLKLFAGFEVALPETLTPEMKRDGIRDDVPLGAEIGKKAAMLAQLVAAAPLRYWTERFGGDPESLCKRAKSADFEAAFMYGWQEAAIREQSVPWINVLLERLKQGEHSTRRERLLEALPGAALESHVLAEVAPSAKLTPANAANAARLAEKLPRPWRPEVGRAILAWMRRHTTHSDALTAGYSRQSLERLATLLPSAVLDEAQSGWPDSGPAWETFTKTEDSFHELLKVRYQLNREFQK